MSFRWVEEAIVPGRRGAIISQGSRFFSFCFAGGPYTESLIGLVHVAVFQSYLRREA